MASLEDLKKRIYTEKEKFGERMTSPELSPAPKPKLVSWNESVSKGTKKNRFWWVSGGIVILISAAVWFFIFGPPGFFEIKDVVVEIIGAKEIKSGDRVTWEIKITNKSQKDLEGAMLVFNFPGGATPVSGFVPSGIFRSRKPLGALRAGESVSQSFDAYVFGGKYVEKNVSAVLEYRPQGSSATFATDASFSFMIVRSPLSVSFAIPKELRIGQSVDMEVHYNSQSEEEIADLYVEVFLPSGFTFDKAFPSSLMAGKFIWKIGSLKPAQTGVIKIKGSIVGANLESKLFKASIGVLDSKRDGLLPYDESSETVIMRSPFLEVALSVFPDRVVFPGDDVSVEIMWRNNSEKEVSDAVLEGVLEGAAIDFRSIKVDGGSYSESAKKIIWNAATYKEFQLIPEGGFGKAVFYFKLKPIIAADPIKSAIRIKTVFTSGKPVLGLEGVDLSGETFYELQIGTRIDLASRVIYFNSIIPNNGTLPPKVGKETTYMVIWSLTNMVNDASNIVVKSFLPPYVHFKNILSPADSDISFDSNSGEVVWRVGRLLAGTGFTRPALQVAFQIGLTPSSNQINTSPILINETNASGRDVFVDQVVSSTEEPVSTSLPDEPGFSFDKKIVVP